MVCYLKERKLMKWVKSIALGMVLLSGGCRGVYLNPKYSQLLDQTAGLSRATANKALEGELDANDMIHALDKQAEVWRMFVDARDGRLSK